MNKITTFTTPDTRWLSNMAYVNIEHDGIIYPSTENFYQALKYLKGWTFDDSATRKNVRLEISKLKPHEAKRYSREHKATNVDFDQCKIIVMRAAQRMKYAQEPFRSKLLATGDAILEGGNWWGDKFWGVDIKTGEGENNLGKLIMQVRNELREELRNES